MHNSVTRLEKLKKKRNQTCAIGFVALPTQTMEINKN
jgi:hypothetical protein